jgi:cold shock CspA family protein/ribosome-associated translation inhibitor RaiA
MQLPLQITFRTFSPSEAVADRIRAKVQELERFHGHLMSCRVLVEALHRHHRKGRLYHVRIDLGVPGGEIVISREHQLAHEHEDVYVAIRDAFNAATRRLEDFVRRQRADTKRHEVPLHGRVARLFPNEGYGFLQTPEGLDVYFHRNAVVGGDFDALRIGSEARFVMQEGEGDKGPQASSVHPIGKHHLPDVEAVPS